MTDEHLLDNDFEGHIVEDGPFVTDEHFVVVRVNLVGVFTVKSEDFVRTDFSLIE